MHAGKGNNDTKPNLSLLEEFGYPCWVLHQDGKQRKLDLKSRQFLFAGINNSTRGTTILTLSLVKFKHQKMLYLL